MKLQRYEVLDSEVPKSDIGDYVLYSDVESLLSRYDKLVGWINKAEHHRGCNVHWGSRQFVMNAEQADRFSKIKTSCDCGLDELKRDIEGEEK